LAAVARAGYFVSLCFFPTENEMSGKKKLYRREDGYFDEDLLQSSLHHLHAASILFKRGPDFYDSAGYLLHLSIELLFKSWQLSLTDKFPGTHSLQDLRQEVTGLVGEIKLSKIQNKTIELIDRLYDLRYPNRKMPTEVGSEDFELALQLFDSLLIYLPAELEEKFSKISPGKKGGRVLMKKPMHIKTDIDFLMNKLHKT
jgi:HEPN domain-containing protein